jgi:hypothetical protein
MYDETFTFSDKLQINCYERYDKFPEIHVFQL